MPFQDLARDYRISSTGGATIGSQMPYVAPSGPILEENRPHSVFLTQRYVRESSQWNDGLDFFTSYYVQWGRGTWLVNTLIFKSSDVGKKLKVVENGEVYRHVPIRRVM